VRLRVSRQRIEDARDDLLALAHGNRDEQSVEDVDQLLVLIVNGLDIDAVSVRPFEEDFLV
jgi:hypothetical protein